MFDLFKDQLSEGLESPLPFEYAVVTRNVLDDGVGVLLTPVALESIREKLDESEGGVTETEDVREYLASKKSEISVSVKLYLLAHEEDVDWNTVAWTSSFSPAPVDLPAVSAGESRLRYSRPPQGDPPRGSLHLVQLKKCANVVPSRTSRTSHSSRSCSRSCFRTRERCADVSCLRGREEGTASERGN